MAEQQLEQIAVELVDRAMRGGRHGGGCDRSRNGRIFYGAAAWPDREAEGGRLQGSGIAHFPGRTQRLVFFQRFFRSFFGRLVDRTLAMAQVTSEDPASGLPEAAMLGRYDGDLELYSEDVAALSTEDRIDYARRAEQAALAADPRIKNSEGAWFEASVGRRAYANSLGFAGSYRSSYCAGSVAPVAEDGGMQRDYWYSVSRRRSALESPEAVGRKAAERTLRKLGGAKWRPARSR